MSDGTTPTVDVFMTDDGPIRVDEMDREGLLAVIEYLKRELDASRAESARRFRMLYPTPTRR